MELLEILRRYKTASLLIPVIAIVLALYLKLCFAQKERDLALSQLAVLNIQIEQQNNAIKEWKKQAEIQNQRLVTAQNNARDYRINYNNEALAISAQRVSTDCTSAINWAIQMSKQLVKKS